MSNKSFICFVLQRLIINFYFLSIFLLI